MKETSLEIKKHIFKGKIYGEEVEYKESPNFSKGNNPTIIVVHHTAGVSTKYSSRNYLLTKNAKASAHIVIEEDGTFSQIVSFDKKAWHAGVSSYKGVKNVNDFSIGIELVNPGKLDKEGKSYFGKRFDFEEDALIYFSNKEAPFHGESCWKPYTDEQINTLTNLCILISKNYPIKDIVGHYEISPGRKTDPSPLLDLQDLKNIVFGREASEQEYKTLVNLNLRSEKFVSKDTYITTIPKNSIVEIISCEYDENGKKWYLVDYNDSHQGWVISDYIKEA